MYNIVRKRKLLERNPKFEGIINFYLILCIFWNFHGDFFHKNSKVLFSHVLLPVGAPIPLGYARMQFLSVSQNRYGITLAGYRDGKSATIPALQLTNRYNYPTQSNQL